MRSGNGVGYRSLHCGTGSGAVRRGASSCGSGPVRRELRWDKRGPGRHYLRMAPTVPALRLGINLSTLSKQVIVR